MRHEMVLNHYQILGVDQSATLVQIKAAYRSLALKYHPDKSTGDEARFKDIAESYAILSDDTKRTMYDMSLNFAGSGFSGSNDILFEGIFIIIDRLGKAFRQRARHTYETTNEPKTPTKTDDIRVSLPVTLYDLFMMTHKKIYVKVYRKKNNILASTKHKLYISLLNYELTHRFEGKADESLDSNVVPGDIVLTLDIIKHDDFRIDTIFSRYDLYTDKDITLYDYYYKHIFEIVFLDGEVISIEAKNMIIDNERMYYVVVGKGLPYYDGQIEHGDLHVSFKVILPKRDELPIACKEYMHKK